MAVKRVEKSFYSQRNILAMPDSFVAIEVKLAKNSGLAVTEDGRKIVRAGTVYPANDATALGIIFNDYDVTDGDEVGALIISGYILTSALPVVPAAAAKAALVAKGIHFLPEFTPVVTLAIDAFAPFAVGALPDIEKEVVMTITGATFRKDLIEAKANWTIAGAATNKVDIKTVEYIDARTVKITVVTTDVAVAGSTTAQPKAESISVGVTGTAVTIATVA